MLHHYYWSQELDTKGLGTMEPGPHETVMQSTALVIHCNGGFTFSETQFVVLGGKQSL